MTAVNTKITTFSLYPDVIKKLSKLCDWLHLQNKSGVLTLLIEKEYRRLRELKGIEEETDKF